jgi:hypothetical protein
MAVYVKNKGDESEVGDCGRRSEWKGVKNGK